MTSVFTGAKEVVVTNSPLTSFLVSTLVASVVWSGAPASRSGVQLAPDGKQTLISKDVGSERWAIALNAEDGSVLGNVFFADGGAPRFVSCERTGTAVDGATYRCFGADRCALGPCAAEDWVLIADVTLPESFFLPPLDFGSVIGETAASIRSVRAADGRSSGVRASADGTHVLVSKDVGAERWAITRDVRDGSVTGNVFFPGGGDPLFVWCEQVGQTGELLGLTCHGADRCLIAPCPREDWTFVANVALPESFFAPPTSVSLETLVDALLVSLSGDENAFVALARAIDKGYSFEQIARAAMSDRLLLSGDVENRSGGVEIPENPPQGLFSLASDTARVQAKLPPPSELYRELGETTGQDERTKLISRLLDQGYSFDQIGRIIRGEDANVVDCTLITDPTAYRECVENYGGTIAVVHFDGSKIDPDDTPPDVVRPETRTPCGNGRIDPGEACDGAELQDETCVTRGFDGGDLRCDEICRFDTRLCRTRTCGDNHADEGELCDGPDLRGLKCEQVDPKYVGGTLGCTGCVFDTRECNRAPVCNNGVIERVGGQPLEVCDGPDLDGKRCSDFPPYVAGLLRCTTSCTLDFSDCRDPGETDCGNRVAEGDEQCDTRDLRGQTCVSIGETFKYRGFTGGALGCDDQCRYVFDGCTTTETCGNDAAEGREYCDGKDLGGQTCQTVHRVVPVGPFSGGTLRCEDCHWVFDGCISAGLCNNEVRDVPFEECDRADFGDQTCERLFGRGGTLLCTADCHIDPRSCEREQRCGDDFAEGTEQCDGHDLRDADCQKLGFLGGTLACGKDCRFDTTGCAQVRCGDDQIDGSEQCDGINLGGATCENLGYVGGGDLHCTEGCLFDTSECKQGPTCGNGVPEGTEQCDGDTEFGLLHQTCLSLGFEGGGTLRCYSNCTYDTRACEEEPRCTELMCPDGTCAPVGADCCGNSTWCDPGSVCVDGGCCPSTQPVLCAGIYCMPPGADCCGSIGWCAPGSVCVPDGCCPATAPKSCGDGTCTTPDRVCCGNGMSCPGGTQCLPAGGCG